MNECLYGMSAEERAAFEQWEHDDGATARYLQRDVDGRYLTNSCDKKAAAWAACAKLYRVELVTLENALDILSGRLLEEQHSSAARIKELEAEVERLRADAARMDWLQSSCETGVPEGFDLRAAIDGEMKGG